jgi:hypothetical protein
MLLPFSVLYLPLVLHKLTLSLMWLPLFHLHLTYPLYPAALSVHFQLSPEATGVLVPPLHFASLLFSYCSWPKVCTEDNSVFWVLAMILFVL